MNKLSNGILSVAVSVSCMMITLLFFLFDLVVMLHKFSLQSLCYTLLMLFVFVVQVITLKDVYNRLKQEESENILNYDYLTHRVRRLEEDVAVAKFNRGL